MFTRSRKLLPARLLAAALAAYLLLASARELVPGLCATLAAVRDGAPACIAAARTCCTTEYASADNSGVPGVRSEPKPHPQCAFCKLVKGLTPSADAVELPANPASPDDNVWQTNTIPRSARICAESRPRDPPAPALV